MKKNKIRNLLLTLQEERQKGFLALEQLTEISNGKPKENNKNNQQQNNK